MSTTSQQPQTEGRSDMPDFLYMLA